MTKFYSQFIIFSMSKYTQIIRYIFAGAIATISNILILFVCVHYFKLWYLLGAVISFCSAVVISYVLQKFWTFRNYSTRDIHKQFIIFFVYNLFMLCVNTLLMYFWVDIIKLWYLFAQAISAFITAFINYTYFNRIIFKKFS